MTRRMFSKLIKSTAVASSVLTTGVMLSLPVLAQTQTSTQSSQSVELSSDALEILCERFPLNSRCEGGSAEAQDTNTSNRTERINPSESDPADAVSDPSEAPVDDAADGMSGTSSSESRSGTVRTQTQRINPSESDPADAVSDPSEAPVDDAPARMSAPTYQTQPQGEPGSGSMTMPTPEGGTVAPKHASALTKQMSETPETSGTSGASRASETSDTVAPAGSSSGTPAAAPETTSPVAPSATPSEAGTPAASISETELQKFAEAVPQIQAIERSTQQEVAQAIDASGFSRERFRQLYQQQTSGAAIDPAPTTDEQQSFTQAYSSIQKIQQDAQSEREQAITAQGLEPQRFDQILAAVLQDPSLQQQVQHMMAQ